MTALGYVWLAVAVAFIPSVLAVIWLADHAPVGEPDRSRLDEADAHANEVVELANEQARRDWCKRRHPGSVPDEDGMRRLFDEVAATPEGRRALQAIPDRYGLTEETVAWLRDRRSS